MAIQLKSSADLEKMRAAGRIVRRVHERCRDLCRPGVTTRQIDEEAAELIEQLGARGLFKGYPGPVPFPANLCISVNDEVVHGIGGDRRLRAGDIVSVDCGVQYQGWCGDSAWTYAVGGMETVEPATRRLCEVTQHVLMIAIENIRPGRRWSQIARLMQNYAEAAGMSVVRDYVGHGIGRQMHEEPKVPNFVSPELLKRDIVLREGLVLAIEPMCTLGSAAVRVLEDQWTVVTVDGLPAAHYEHTIAVTRTGAAVLTDGN